MVLLEQGQGRTFTGRLAVQKLLQAFLADGFATAQVELHTSARDEQAAVWEFTFTGRHSGRFMGLPPTGRNVCLPMAVVCQIREGQVTRMALYYDAGTLLRQLGLAL
ncbi:MAG: ester cyclase [Chloroflexi bacterium]|nr:ester cyclase [Chloroflexota bacterium]MCI0579445.1 ester cyclase [Chloroflexota bacterium]MCI0644992.1 ester cyclase [Chloroflexota bacterium]